MTAETRREELVEAAIEVIGRKGLSRTTLADVASRAGLSYGNVTFRFKTKSALLLAALTKVTNEYMDHREAAAEASGGSAAARLDAMISASFDRRLTSQKKIGLWHAFLSECHLQASYRKLFAGLRVREYSFTRALCEEIMATEDAENDDVHLLAMGITSVVEGLWFNMRVAPNALSREEARKIARMYLELLFPNAYARLLPDNAAAPSLQIEALHAS